MIGDSDNLMPLASLADSQVRLPVLAGARLVLYMSCELWHDDRPTVMPRDPEWPEDRMNAEIQAYVAQIQVTQAYGLNLAIDPNTGIQITLTYHLMPPFPPFHC